MYVCIYLSICKFENEAILRDFLSFCSTEQHTEHGVGNIYRTDCEVDQEKVTSSVILGKEWGDYKTRESR